MNKKIFLALILASLITGFFFFILKPALGADFYRSNRNTTIQADECPKCPSDSTCCRRIRNNSTTEDVFVPTMTCGEWSEFKINKSSFIALSPCCTGNISLALDPSSVLISGSVTATASGLSNCDANVVYIRRDSCSGTQQCTCNVSAGSCSCSFTAPSSAGTYTYLACTDKNLDGDYADAGESASRSLTVVAPSGSLSCSSSTTSSITLSYSFSYSNSGQVSLFRGTTLLTTFSGESGSGTFTDYNLNSGASYPYSLRDGTLSSSPQLASRSCSTLVPPGSLSCSSSTTNSITLNYSFSESASGQVSLFRGTSRLTTFSGSSGSGSYTDTGLSAGTSYTYSLRDGTLTSSTLIASASCSTTALPSGTLSCNSSTTTHNMIGLNLTFSNATQNVELYRGSQYLVFFSPPTCSACSHTDGASLSPNTSYTYRLMHGSAQLAQVTCSTNPSPIELPACPEQTWGAGVWGNPDVGWYATAYEGPYRCRLGTSCTRTSLWEAINTTATTFRSYGPAGSRRTVMCKIGDQANNISACPFSGGSSGYLYITSTHDWWSGWSSNINDWCPVGWSQCHKVKTSLLGGSSNIVVHSGQYAGECYHSTLSLTTSYACYVCVVK